MLLLLLNSLAVEGCLVTKLRKLPNRHHLRSKRRLRHLIVHLLNLAILRLPVTYGNNALTPSKQAFLVHQDSTGRNHKVCLFSLLVKKKYMPFNHHLTSWQLQFAEHLHCLPFAWYTGQARIIVIWLLVKIYFCKLSCPNLVIYSQHRSLWTLPFMNFGIY